MIENYKGQKFETKGIDLATFNKQELIDHFNKNVKITGINVLLLVYKVPIITRTKGGIEIPTQYADKEDEYQAYAGMILQIGPDAFIGKNFPNGSYAEVGDWVIFPRSASLQLRYEDEPIVMVEDFKIKMIIDDPSKLSKYNK